MSGQTRTTSAAVGSRLTHRPQGAPVTWKDQLRTDSRPDRSLHCTALCSLCSECCLPAYSIVSCHPLRLHSLSRRGSSWTSSGRATPWERGTPAEPRVFQALVTMYGAPFPLGRTTFLRAETGLSSCLRCTIQQHAGYEINRCRASAETSPYHSH